ncbi:MAG: 4Fe-4S dicluster domain-containing protein [Thermoplasmata archaeon]|nr:MAG: 4Fe-4S dicluster domain-containing protein [Thermoplasmata archaeon]
MPLELPYPPIFIRNEIRRGLPRIIQFIRHIPQPKYYKLFFHFIAMYVKAIPEKCCGCVMCEVVCSMKHWNVVNSYRSGIRVEKKNVIEDVPFVCSHGHLCNFECIDACKFDAMKKNDAGIVYVDYENCTGCRACERACPLHAVWIHEKKAYKCDLCGGDPECVKFCSQDALVVEV